MRLEWAGMHLECISIAAGIYFDITVKSSAGMQFKCRRNLSIAARMRLEFSRNVPIGPRMSPDVVQNTAESHIKEYINNFHSAVIPAHAPLCDWVWNSLPNVARIWKFFIPAGSAWFLLIRNKCDGGITLNISWILM